MAIPLQLRDLFIENFVVYFQIENHYPIETQTRLSYTFSKTHGIGNTLNMSINQRIILHHLNYQHLTYSSTLNGFSVSDVDEVLLFHYSDVIMSSLASQFTSLLIIYSTVYSGADQKKTSKLRVTSHWPLRGEFTGDRWVPRTKGQWRGKCFHLIMSSCQNLLIKGLMWHLF